MKAFRPSAVMEPPVKRRKPIAKPSAYTKEVLAMAAAVDLTPAEVLSELKKMENGR